jgi:asparagine synthetase B (glutamine-hydrolysing)
MSRMHFYGPRDANVAWDGRRLLEPGDFYPGAGDLRGLRGAAASVCGSPATGWRVVRDPLGINKLFWVRDERGECCLAARPRVLVDAGHRLADVMSVPPGTVVDVGPSNAAHESLVPASWFAAREHEVHSLEALGGGIRSAITRYLSTIATQLRPDAVYVCLSGGLDSSGIAAMASEIFPSTIAVSFDIKRRGHDPSDDRLAAERVAADLGLTMLDVSVTEDELLDHMDTVLAEGVDWRDFNVHAGLVNAALAAGIAAAGGSRESVVLTGDLANEFLVDYEAESYRGRTYYRLPRLEPRPLRTWLVRGLDSCNREVGVFSAFGLRVVQPYAVAVDEYMSVGSELLERVDRKNVLDRIVFGSLIPEHVYSRKKVRAQVGSEEVGGVLAVCLDRAIDQAWLRRRFARLHGVADERELDRFMRAGRYRSAVPSFQET